MNDKYLTYNEYKGLGGSLEETPFNILEYRARKTIDLYCFNRIKTTQNLPEEVKMCVFDLIEVLDNDSKNIASESVGSYSVSYKGSKEETDLIVDTIKKYLTNVKVSGVYLLYKGL